MSASTSAVDVRGYRRARSNDGDGMGQVMPPGLPRANVLVVNENGQVLGNQPALTRDPVSVTKTIEHIQSHTTGGKRWKWWEGWR